MIEMGLRWRDADQLGHVNHTVPLTLLEDARNRWLDGVLGSGTSDVDWVVARLEIDYGAELRVGDGPVALDLSVARVGEKSVTTSETVARADGVVAVRVVAVLVAWDHVRHRSRPMADRERAAFVQLVT